MLNTPAPRLRTYQESFKSAQQFAENFTIPIYGISVSFWEDTREVRPEDFTMSQALRSVKTDMALTIDWEKDPSGKWYNFEAHNIDFVHGSGVCIVWHEGEMPATVCVGHGDLAQCLYEMYENRAIGMYRKLGTMRFAWAEVPSSAQRGVARFISEQLKPAFEDIATLVPSIPVNLPD